MWTIKAQPAPITIVGGIQLSRVQTERSQDEQCYVYIRS